MCSLLSFFAAIFRLRSNENIVYLVIVYVIDSPIPFVWLQRICTCFSFSVIMRTVCEPTSIYINSKFLCGFVYDSELFINQDKIFN